MSHPEPGIYHDVHFSDYLSWDLPSQSIMAKAQEWTWFHAHEMMEGRLTLSSPAMTLGTKIHTRLLEPEKYAEIYSITTPCAGIKRDGKRCGIEGTSWRGPSGSWFCSTHAKRVEGAVHVPDSERMSEQEQLKIEAIVENVRQHEEALAFLQLSSGREVAMVGELEGVAVKGRIDSVTEDVPFNGGSKHVLLDIKSMQVGTGKPGDRRRAIRKYSYDTQSAWYADLYRSIQAIVYQREVDVAWFWLFIESDYPFLCTLMRAAPKMLALGRAKYKRILQQYEQNLEDGVWPGYGGGVTVLEPEQFELLDFGIQ